MVVGVDDGVGAGEIGVAVEGVAGVAIDQEAHLFDAREVGVEGADDGVDGEHLGLDAGGVVVGEGAVEIDDGQLAAGDMGFVGECAGSGFLVGLPGRGLAGGDGRLQGKVEQEDVVDGGAAFEGVGGVLVGVLGDEACEEGVGAGGRFFGQCNVAVLEGDGAVGVVGHGEVDRLAGSGDGRGKGCFIAMAGQLFAGLLASVQEEERHEQTSEGKNPEENALVAGDHCDPFCADWVVSADWARDLAAPAALAAAMARD